MKYKEYNNIVEELYRLLTARNFQKFIAKTNDLKQFIRR